MAATLLCATVLAACDERRPVPPPEAPRVRVVVEEAAARAAERAGVDLEAIVDAAVDRVGRHLDLPETVISVLVRPGSVIPETGIGGFTDPSTGEVFVYVDPRRRDFASAVDDWLALTIAHELHHATRVAGGPGYGYSLQMTIVSEGLADVLSLETFPHRPPPWTRALGHRALCLWWRRALRRDLYDHDVWFYGAGRVPRWAGYSIGYALVRSYLRAHPSETAAELVSAPVHQIVTGALLCGRSSSR